MFEEIPVDRNTKDLHCTPTMPTMYRSPLGQINGFCRVGHSSSVGTSFSGCAPKAASPTIVDVKAFNKQTGKTIQDAPSETSILATHRTVENNWIP